MRKFLVSLFVVASAVAVAAPTASAICYDRVLRNGTIIHECR
jgi:hypothetical protein